VKPIILGMLEPKGVAQHLKPIVHFYLIFFSYDTLWVLIKDSLGIMGEKKTMGVMKMECSPLWAFLFKNTHMIFTFYKGICKYIMKK
jgi:hypothetical protein